MTVRRVNSPFEPVLCMDFMIRLGCVSEGRGRSENNCVILKGDCVILKLIASFPRIIESFFY